MYAKDTIEPLTINTKANANGRNGVFTAATFQYTEEPSLPLETNRSHARVRHASDGSPVTNRGQNNALRSQYGATVPPSAMYVRALYNYEADDRTSLS